MFSRENILSRLKSVPKTVEIFLSFFSPKDENLGVLKSTVYSCACEGEPVWEHVVGGGREPAGSAGSPKIGP